MSADRHRNTAFPRGVARVITVAVAAGTLFSACGGAAKPASTATVPTGGAVSTATTQPVTTTTVAPIATFSVAWEGVECPTGTPVTTSCYTNVGSGDVVGLGQVTERYTLLAEGADPSCGDWRASVHWTVRGKGTIEFAIKSPGCQSINSPNGTTKYVIKGGAGAYRGASGSGTLDSIGHETSPGRGTGTDTWTGRLSVSSVN
jgi:hypothetical protein